MSLFLLSLLLFEKQPKNIIKTKNGLSIQVNPKVSKKRERATIYSFDFGNIFNLINFKLEPLKLNLRKWMPSLMYKITKISCNIGKSSKSPADKSGQIFAICMHNFCVCEKPVFGLSLKTRHLRKSCRWKFCRIFGIFSYVAAYSRVFMQHLLSLR